MTGDGLPPPPALRATPAPGGGRGSHGSIEGASRSDGRRSWPNGSVWVTAAGQGLFLVLVHGPLWALIAYALGSAGSVSRETLALAIPAGRQLDLFGRSLGLSVTIAAVGTVLGVVIATAVVFTRARWARVLGWLVLVAIPIPAYEHALAWTTVLFRLNGRLAAAGWPRLPQTGEPLVVWVHAASLLPLAVALGVVALSAVPADLVEAGRVARRDLTVLRRITLPMAAPVILAGAGVLFLLALLDYSVASLYQVNVYALSIFADFSASGEVLRAAMLALPMIALTAVVIVATQSAWRQSSTRPVRSGEAGPGPPFWPRAFVWLQRSAIAVLLLQQAVLVVSLVVAVGGWRSLVDTVTPARGELAYSIGVAVAAAMLAVLAALAVAPRLAARGAASRLWWLLATLPLAIPAPLVGLGLIVLWNRPPLTPVYLGGWTPALAGAARFAPLAAIVLAAQLRRQDPLLADAARVFQPGEWSGWWRVRLPMLAPGLVAAAGLVFALTLGELGATLLVAAPGHSTLTIRIYNYLHYGASDAVAGLCLVMALATTAAGAVAAGAFALGTRWLAGGEATR